MFLWFAPLPAWAVKKKDIKQVPLKIKSPVESDDRVGGYCPTCQGTVLIEKTILRRFRGYYCSWCGQMIDCDEIFKEDLHEL